MLFYGRLLNMSKEEILITKYGEMMDYISCYSIAFGGMKEKKKRIKRYEDAITIR